MKRPAAVERRRLVILLEAALMREQRLWKVPVFRHGSIQGTNISSAQLREMILWLGEMSRLFRFCPDTSALGVSILNRLLSTVKAQPKYLRCIAFTSLVLAAKINEEDEVIGSIRDLAMQSGCSFSTAEILRMERIILDKLHWDLYIATPVDFIHIVTFLFLYCLINTFSSNISTDPAVNASAMTLAVLWTRQVQHCMACHQLWQFRGSTLALAIITLELEVLVPDWFSVFTDLLKKAQMDSGEFIYCKEMVDEYLHSLEFSLPPNAVYILDGAQIRDEGRAWRSLKRLRRARTGRRSKEQGDCDEYYDGFGRLYGEVTEVTEVEEEDEEDSGLQKNVSPCPPLHPAVN
uniref:Cyclin I family member 2 n=1 Tax=Tetraodon nigroviridis TaxID=99883 RepID=H3DLG5_TETNG